MADLEKRKPSVYTNMYLMDTEGNTVLKLGAIWHYNSSGDKAIAARMKKDPEYINKMIAAGQVAVDYNSADKTKKIELPEMA